MKKKIQVLNYIIANKNIVFFLVIFILMLLIILLTIHNYNLSSNGYKIIYSNTVELYNSNYESIVENNKINLESFDVIEQKIIINEKNPKYIVLFLQSNYKEVYDRSYNIQILNLNNEVLVDRKLLIEEIEENKFKVNIEKLTKGEYILKIENIGKSATSILTFNNNVDDSFSLDNVVYKGTINFATFYKDNDKYLDLYKIIGIITIIFLIVIFLNYKFTNIKLHNRFLFTSIIIYLMYLVLIPPTLGHDELHHWSRVFEITEGGFISEIRGNETGYVMPSGVFLNIPWLDEFRYSDLFEKEVSKIDYSNKTFISNATMAVYSPLQYLPQVIGVGLGKLITNNSLIIFYIGRLFNFIVCTLFLYFSIKIIPYFKTLIYLLSFIPIAIEGFTTLSGDGLLISIVFFLLSYILNIIDKKEVLAKKHYTIFLLLGIFIALSKIVYVPVMGLLLLIPSESFKNKKDKIFKLSIIYFIVILINLLWIKTVNPHLYAYTKGKSDLQLSFILSNPFEYIKIIFNTFINYGHLLVLQSYGKNLLWFELIKLYIVPILLIITSIIVVFNEKCKKINTKFNNLIIISIVFIVTMFIFTSLYIQWTDYKSVLIQGLQGRYFICILPLILVLLSNVIKIKNKLSYKLLENIVVYTCLFVNYLSILQIFIKFF